MAAPIDEFELIARHFAPLAGNTPGALGLRDDAGLIRVPDGMDLVVSADTVVAGIHFPDDMAAGDIARRALRVNLSDIAAKGAAPVAYTLALQLPSGIDDAWLAAFAGALAVDQQAYGPGLLGGDTTGTSGPLAINISIFGYVTENKMIKRSGAVAGDDVYVTGSVGDAALGLAVIQGRMSLPDAGDRDALAGRFLRPEPRVFTGARLVGLASAAADVSDGLLADLGHVCTASGVGAEIRLDDVPLSDSARAAVTDDQPLRLSLLAGGDDYEIVLTAPQSARSAIADAARDTGVAITRIGRTVARDTQDRPVVVLDEAGNRLDAGDGGFRHFRAEVPRPE
ncbi:MAG: thiamine-phosphate kinase [Alphaproteobacteria bacterium]|nr:thiamine-phosphate kinase [Alphaproteobacteria bacterium]